jgi:hypothetical protein
VGILNIVVKTYSTQDGLDVDTLLDSDKHGALAYNDFLILLGYIGKSNKLLPTDGGVRDLRIFF